MSSPHGSCRNELQIYAVTASKQLWRSLSLMLSYMDGGKSSQELHRSILTPCRHARCRANFAHASRLAPLICNSHAFFQQERTLAPDPQFYCSDPGACTPGSQFQI